MRGRVLESGQILDGDTIRDERQYAHQVVGSEATIVLSVSEAKK